MNPRPEMRISDAERESAVSALGEHYASGRLTREEYDERAEQAWAARTASALAPLFLDLPAPHASGPTVRPAPTGKQAQASAPAGRSPRPRVPFVPVLLLVLGLAMLLHVPWPFFLLLGWLLWRGFLFRGFTGRWSQAGCGRGWSSYRHW